MKQEENIWTLGVEVLVDKFYASDQGLTSSATFEPSIQFKACHIIS